jgi:hypothetical protein
MADDTKLALSEFVRFAQNLRGDEKSEAQPFLDHFFRALGHEGVIEAGATFEFRVAKKPGSPQLELIKGNSAPLPRVKGGKKFADLLWPDRVLIEMKSRGENLEKHRRVLIVECRRSPKPIFLKDGNTEQFFIRTGPSSTPLTPSQTQEYIQQRRN